MITCDRCGQQAQRIYPYMRQTPTVVDAFDPRRILPRGALTDEMNAAIPFGEHPDDDRFGQMCEACAQGWNASVA